MRALSFMPLVCLMAGCATHHASVVRCDGPLVPINAGGEAAAAPLADVPPDVSRDEHVE